MTDIVFLGAKTIGWDCLQILHAQAANLGWRLIAVATNPNAALGQHQQWNDFCTTQHIPLLSHLDELPNCDIIVSVQYHQILKARHIAKAKQIALNLHLAPLPEYRGCNQFSFAIIDQAKQFGVTLHRLETGIDSGDILFERRFELPPDCFVQDLYERSCQAARELWQQHIGDIARGNYTLIPQSSLIAERGTSYHYRHEIDALKEIDLDWSAEKIARHLRATYFPPFDPPYSWVAGRKVTWNITP